MLALRTRSALRPATAEVIIVTKMRLSTVLLLAAGVLSAPGADAQVTSAAQPQAPAGYYFLL